MLNILLKTTGLSYNGHQKDGHVIMYYKYCNLEVLRLYINTI